MHLKKLVGSCELYMTPQNGRAQVTTMRSSAQICNYCTYHVNRGAVLNGRGGHIRHQIQQQLHALGVAVQRRHMQRADATVCRLIHQPRESAAANTTKLAAQPDLSR